MIIAIPIILIRTVLYWGQWDLLIYIVLSLVIGIIIAIVMLLFGLWGGADIIALVCLSLLSPISMALTTGLPSIFNQNFLELILPMSLALVMNAAIIQIPLPIIIAIKNYATSKKNPEAYRLPQAPKLQKIFASFLGEPLPIHTILAKPVFYYQSLEKNTIFTNEIDLQSKYPVPFIRLASEPLLRWQRFSQNFLAIQKLNYAQMIQPTKVQETKNNLRYKWSFDFTIGLKSEEEDLYRQRKILEHATQRELQRKYLWVQYSVPFLIPMLLGYILAFFNINLLFELFKYLHFL